MRVVIPTRGFELPEPSSESESNNSSGRLSVDWQNDRIVLFSNGKPNSRELLRGVNERISPVLHCGSFDLVAKGNPAQPAPDELIADVASRYQVAILATAD